MVINKVRVRGMAAGREREGEREGWGMGWGRREGIGIWLGQDFLFLVSVVLQPRLHFEIAVSYNYIRRRH